LRSCRRTPTKPARLTPETMHAAKAASRLRGVLDGHDLARMFAWMRPNDLIWNYWGNNYLLGNAPPAFDILYWNAATTRDRKCEPGLNVWHSKQHLRRERNRR